MFKKSVQGSCLQVAIGIKIPEFVDYAFAISEAGLRGTLWLRHV